MASTFIDRGKSLIVARRYQEAKEALRTAIRIDSTNLEAWRWYDSATELHHISCINKVHTSPLATIASESLDAFLSVVRTDYYRNNGNLLVVGEISNSSRQSWRNIEITVILTDTRTNATRTLRGPVSVGSRGLPPYAQALFEISTPDPGGNLQIAHVYVNHRE